MRESDNNPPNNRYIGIGTAVTPIFGQLVAFTYPSGFRPAFENSTSVFYIQESVPMGETTEKWSQMITLTGTKGGSDEKLSAMSLLQGIAAGFQRSCPNTFAGKGLGKVSIGASEGVVALVGCGHDSSGAGAGRSEVAFLISVKGTSDIYMIQWAERGAPIEQAPTFDEAMWRARFQQLLPIRICDRVPNEPAPYISCLNSH
jgi:hypothetical protein